MKALYLALFFFSPLVFAKQYVLTPLTMDAASKISETVQSEGVRIVEPVFSASEKSALETLQGKSAAFSSAIVLEIKREEDFQKFSQRIKSKDYQIEENKKDRVLQQRDPEPLQHLQWGVENLGRVQRVQVTPRYSEKIFGKDGEDIGLKGVPAESKDPLDQVIVAVLDTGIDYDINYLPEVEGDKEAEVLPFDHFLRAHPDLLDQIHFKPKECEAYFEYFSCNKACERLDEGIEKCKKECGEKFEKVDHDGNGYPMDCAGWNVTPQEWFNDVKGNQEVYDTEGHGTHVSGIIAAARNQIGVLGVIENVKLLPVKVILTSPRNPVRPQSLSFDEPEIPKPNEEELAKILPPEQRFTLASLVARGFLYAIRSGADVIHMSLAWPIPSGSILMKKMIDLANRLGRVVVSSAGNDSTFARVFPCVHKGVVCVASYSTHGGLSYFSNFGSPVDVSAPGHRILSTWPRELRARAMIEVSGYEYSNGTSMAAPFVSGMVAKLIGKCKEEKRLGKWFYFREDQTCGAQAKARLLVSARNDQEIDLRPKRGKSAPKYISRGKAKLNAAFEAVPQPLLSLSNKDPVRAELSDGPIKLKVSLENLWVDSVWTRITPRLVAPFSETFGEFVGGPVEIETPWQSGDQKDIEFQIQTKEGLIPQHIAFEIVVEAKATELSPVTITELRGSVDVYQNIERALAQGKLVEMPFSESRFIRDQTRFRTIIAKDAKPLNEYAAILWANTARGPAERIDIFSENDGTFELKASARFGEIFGANLMDIHRVDYDLDGESDYVFIYSVTRKIGDEDVQSYRFKVVKVEGNRLRPLMMNYAKSEINPEGRGYEFEYDNFYSKLPLNFPWMSLPARTIDGVDYEARMVPAWITPQTAPLPKLSRQEVESVGGFKRDPFSHSGWKLKLRDLENEQEKKFGHVDWDIWFLYLSGDGVRALSPPKNSNYLAERESGFHSNEYLAFARLLAQNDKQKAKGELPVLLVNGQGFALRYLYAVIRNGRVESIRPIELPEYRLLFGIDGVYPAIPLGDDAIAKTTFPGMDGESWYRVGFYSHDGEKNIWDELEFQSFYKFDTIRKSLTGYFAENLFISFSWTNFEIQYDDSNDQVGTISLNKMSFLAGEETEISMFPEVAWDGSASRRIPALIIPEGPSVTGASEVVVPIYDGTKLKELMKPAQFHLPSGESCKAPEIVPASRESVSSLDFFCGKKILRLTLSF